MLAAHERNRKCAINKFWTKKSAGLLVRGAESMVMKFHGNVRGEVQVNFLALFASKPHIFVCGALKLSGIVRANVRLNIAILMLFVSLSWGEGLGGHVRLFMLGFSPLFEVFSGPQTSLTQIIFGTANRPNINKWPGAKFGKISLNYLDLWHFSPPPN